MIKEKWHKMTLFQQMGNIGSEVFKMIGLNNSQESFLRVLELIDLTIEDKRRKEKLFEILRLREVICNFYLNKGVYDVSKESLKKYFIPFALKT